MSETEYAGASGFDGDGIAASLAAFWAGLKRVVYEGALLVGTVVWTAFWLNVVRLHLTADSMVGADRMNAAFTFLTVVMPAVGFYAWHLAGRPELVGIGSLLDRTPSDHASASD